MTRKQEKALLSYDSYEQERMARVIKAIADGRLIYMRFFEDGSGASFYFRDFRDCADIPYYYLTSFDTEQTNVILMGRCIDKKSFGL